MRIAIVTLFAALLSGPALPNPLPVSSVVHDPGGYISATPGTASGTNGDVIGKLKDFDIDYIRFTITAAQQIEALIRVNYHHGATSSPFALNAWSIGGVDGRTVTLNAGDLLFDVDGQYRYGVPLTAHDSLLAGSLYQITNTQQAHQVLGLSSTSTSIRPTYPVWMAPAGADLIGGKVSMSYARVGTTSAVDISLIFNPSSQFLVDLATQGLGIHWAVATCGNDVVDGRIQLGAVPEPGTLVLMGCGLLALGLAGRRRLRRG